MRTSIHFVFICLVIEFVPKVWNPLYYIQLSWSLETLAASGPSRCHKTRRIVIGGLSSVTGLHSKSRAHVVADRDNNVHTI